MKKFVATERPVFRESQQRGGNGSSRVNNCFQVGVIKIKNVAGDAIKQSSIQDIGTVASARVLPLVQSQQTVAVLTERDSLSHADNHLRSSRPS